MLTASDRYETNLTTTGNFLKLNFNLKTTLETDESCAGCIATGTCVKDGRSGISDTIRSSTEVGMHAVRGGDIVGDHTVLFAGMGERIELRHMAHNRSIFAHGAVATAKWLDGKDPGLYTMNDMLGL